MKVEVAIVGAGIVGLAHAYVAAKSGRSVAVFERSPMAIGASIRNFGMIWPIGLPAGPLHQAALHSREIWLEVLDKAKIPYLPEGSLHVAYRDDEAAVGKEFSERAPALGYECSWLSAAETLERSLAVQPEELRGALYSPAELTVDPREVVHALPGFLAKHYGVRFFFNTAVQSAEESCLQAGNRRCEAERIIIAGGDDFQTLFPEYFRDIGLTRCKLQMMRTHPQPERWRLGPSLAFGLTFRHYSTFRICPSFPALKERIAREMPEFDRWAIHVMISQNSLGELTIGDSHEYGLAVNIFDNPQVNELMLNYARRYLRAPTLQIAQQWHGVYSKHPERPYLRIEPANGVSIVTVTNGLGMTLSFGIAEETFRNAAALKEETFRKTES